MAKSIINRGLTMGCPLSPFLANLFMSFRETELTQFEWLSRYGKGMVDKILDKMNSLSETIQFTVEREIKGVLLEFDIYIENLRRLQCYTHTNCQLFHQWCRLLNIPMTALKDILRNLTSSWTSLVLMDTKVTKLKDLLLKDNLELTKLKPFDDNDEVNTFMSVYYDKSNNNELRRIYSKRWTLD